MGVTATAKQSASGKNQNQNRHGNEQTCQLGAICMNVGWGAGKVLTLWMIDVLRMESSEGMGTTQAILFLSPVCSGLALAASRLCASVAPCEGPCECDNAAAIATLLAGCARQDAHSGTEEGRSTRWVPRHWSGRRTSSPHSQPKTWGDIDS